MREIVYKNLTLPVSGKREISIQETVNEFGIVSRILKRSRYFIKSIAHISSKKEFDRWVLEKKNNPSPNSRFFHILKKHSDKDKKDKVLCRARGTFFAVVGREIYNIVFVHSVEVEIEDIKNKKGC